MAKSIKKQNTIVKKEKYKYVSKDIFKVNFSELNNTEKISYIDSNYASFLEQASMYFTIGDFVYNLKGDFKSVQKQIINYYIEQADYTEQSLLEETVYEIEDWDIVRKELDPETYEIVDRITLKELYSDNTYNFSYLGLVQLNWRLYYDADYNKYFYVIFPHLGGDIHGNYGNAIILEGSDKDELLYRFYNSFVSGFATVYFKFIDGSELHFFSEKEFYVFNFNLSNKKNATGVAEKYLQDINMIDSINRDDFLEQTVDIYLTRKGLVPKMMSGGLLDDETPTVYVSVLGDYNDGKWIDLSLFSSGDEVMIFISEWINNLNEEDGGNREEYEFLDYEGFGKELYDEYMGSNEFEEIIEAYKKYLENDFPKDVIKGYQKNLDTNKKNMSDVIDEMESNFIGKYENYYDFGYDMVFNGVYSPSIDDVYIDDTKIRVLADEEAEHAVDKMSFKELLDITENVKDEYIQEVNDLENKISELDSEIEDLKSLGSEVDTYDEYEQISNEIELKELERDDAQLLLDDIDSRYSTNAYNEAKNMLYETSKNNLTNDLEGWLSDYGYEKDDYSKISFLTIDYDKIGNELGNDYLVVFYDGYIYVFSNYEKGGVIKISKNNNKKEFYLIEHKTRKIVSGHDTKEDAINQRKSLIKENPNMRFEIFSLKDLESKGVNVLDNKNKVKISYLDKLKHVSVDTYRYGKDKSKQISEFLKKHDIKGKISRGSRGVWDKTKKGGRWVQKQWEEVDFGDGKGKARFFDRGGYVGKGELVWKKMSKSDRISFLNNHFTPEITPRSQEVLVGKDFRFLPKIVKIKIDFVYSNIDDYEYGGSIKGYEILTKPKPVTTPTPTKTPKPDKNNPYKPKTSPPPKAETTYFALIN